MIHRSPGGPLRSRGTADRRRTTIIDTHSWSALLDRRHGTAWLSQLRELGISWSTVVVHRSRAFCHIVVASDPPRTDPGGTVTDLAAGGDGPAPSRPARETDALPPLLVGGNSRHGDCCHPQGHLGA
ncbi:hypothetical protein [Pseudonocardia sp. N23]|uniref:hypothetical protein n=1 Tax=Pseudonocardia sp. N23 TaxID=1987376 RepID=UPI000C02A574|nr:hypothetical protein [Pseudonocardia sp. N23]GAY11160.1 hypothetical protein TOK_5667 [Pseudonocardia sp. N23]